MAVAKFNWHGTNPNKAFRYQKPPMSAWGEMVYFNATKAENEAAYNALVNHGPVSDFKTKVWNDICAKVYDLCDEWQINDVYRKSAVWSPFIHEPDRAAWEALAKSKWPDWDEYQVEEWVDNMWRTWKPGTFTAWDYNVLYGQWLLPVGLQKFEVQRGQRLKGEYILRLVEIINHWTELSPLTVKFSTSYKWGKKGKSAVLPSASIDPDYLEMHFMLRDGTRVDDSIQIHIKLDLNLLIEKMTIAELISCPIKSLINFMKLNVKCKIWDKFPIYVSTIESAIAACVLRKLMESSISVETQIKASMILSLIRFAESTDNIVRVSAESDAIARVPKKLQSKTQYITSQTDAFMDASYMRGDGLLADAKIRIETDVMPEAVNSGTYLASLAIAEIICETTLDRVPTASLEGNAVASAGSEAGVVLARSILILASTVEDNLVSEEEMILAADFERTLTID